MTGQATAFSKPDGSALGTDHRGPQAQYAMCMTGQATAFSEPEGLLVSM